MVYVPGISNLNPAQNGVMSAPLLPLPPTHTRFFKIFVSVCGVWGEGVRPKLPSKFGYQLFCQINLSKKKKIRMRRLYSWLIKYIFCLIYCEENYAICRLKMQLWISCKAFYKEYLAENQIWILFALLVFLKFLQGILYKIPCKKLKTYFLCWELKNN